MIQPLFCPRCKVEWQITIGDDSGYGHQKHHPHKHPETCIANMGEKIERLEECVESWYSQLYEIAGKFNMNTYDLRDPGTVVAMAHTDEEIEREKNGEKEAG